MGQADLARAGNIPPAAELEQQLQAITPQEMATTCKEHRKAMADLAAKAAAAQNMAPWLKAFFTGQLQRFKAMCDKPTTQSIRDYLWYSLEKDTKTCRIWTNPWEETFTKQLGDKWVSNQGLSGICGVVLVSTLEHKIGSCGKPQKARQSISLGR